MTGRQRPGSGALRTGILMAATMTTGLTAGVFADWSNAVMPGLSSVDDRTFVAAFRALDASITSPLFLGVGFMGALLLTALSAVLHLRAEQRPVLMWVGAALVCSLVVFVITFGVHEPLNEQLRTAGEPDSNAGFAAVRAQLDEARWTAWNTVRAVASTIAFGCLAWALAIHRQPGPIAGRRAEG
ncbi:DUF1772 domain-containing protein [Streptomyces sp. NPDC096176]|uniref:anthrone oxygenase family protein n=1 Tax=Streptomyces sp. NPDC096176 TaxID=3366079 RepID=UPI0038020513